MEDPLLARQLDYAADSILPNTFLLKQLQPVRRTKNQANKHAGPQEANPNAGTEDIIDAGDSEKEDESAQDCFVLPIWSSYSSTINPDLKTDEKPVDKEEQVFLDELERLKRQEKDANNAAEALRKDTPAKASSTNIVNTVSTPVSTASPYDGLSLSDPTNPEQDDSEIPPLEDIYQNPTDGIFTNSSYDDEGAVADFTNLETVVNVSPIPTSRINSFHPSALILGDPNSAVQTRSKVNKSSGAHAFVSYVQKQRRNNHKDFQHCLFACFLSQNEPKKISEALEDENLPYGKRLLEQNGFIEIRRMREDCGQTKARFLDPKIPHKVYKVVKALYGLHQAPRAWYATLSTFLLKNRYRRGTIDKTLFIKKDKHDIILVQVYVDDIIFGSTKKYWCDEFEALMKSRFQMSSMGEHTFFLRLQVKQKEDGIFISQDKYVAEILKKFDFVNVKTASTPIETQKPLVKDEEASDVDVHLYRSMIGSLMYLTASRPDIMFVTIVATSTIEAEYVAAASCCGQVLWIQNQMLDYGFNFMNTKIYIDNESTICIVKNPVYHSKTKHIAIRHHFIRDAYEKKLIQVLKIHTDDNVADLLTKAFDVSRFQFLVTIMAVLESCPKHNMVAYLEKTDGNAEFHDIIDFLTRKFHSSCSHLAGKPVSISEASIRSDLLFP
ncbi:putative ribonuclease H-like domain-containing protein [Tanacetum coccineum]